MVPSEQLKKKALELIRRQNTMTLATAGDHQAWAAPVYYVFYSGGFYFFSDPKSRHIQEALGRRHAAAAIFRSVDTWQGIQGIQMSGRVRPAGTGLTAMKALRAYVAAYAYTIEFFEPGQTLNLESFFKRFKVKLYCLTPDVVYYLDNQIKFGFREQITLTEDD